MNKSDEYFELSPYRIAKSRVIEPIFDFNIEVIDILFFNFFTNLQHQKCANRVVMCFDSDLCLESSNRMP